MRRRELCDENQRLDDHEDGHDNLEHDEPALADDVDHQGEVVLDDADFVIERAIPFLDLEGHAQSAVEPVERLVLPGRAGRLQQRERVDYVRAHPHAAADEAHHLAGPAAQRPVALQPRRTLREGGDQSSTSLS